MRKTILIIVLSVLVAGFVFTAVYLASIDSKSDIFAKWYRRGTGLTKRPGSDDTDIKSGFRYGQPRDKFSRRLSIENTSGRVYYRAYKNLAGFVFRIEKYNKENVLIARHVRKLDDDNRMIQEDVTDKDSSLMESTEVEYDDEKYIATVTAFDSWREMQTITKVYFNEYWTRKLRIETHSNINRLVRDDTFQYWPNGQLNKMVTKEDYGMAARNYYDKTGRRIRLEEYAPQKDWKKTGRKEPYLRKITRTDYEDKQEIVAEFNNKGLKMLVTAYELSSGNKRNKFYEEVFGYDKKDKVTKRIMKKYSVNGTTTIVYDADNNEVSREETPVNNE